MSYTNFLYHIVFGTKHRNRTITPEIRSRLHQYLGGIVRSLGGIALEINGIDDHVHLLVKLKHTMSFPDFMRDLKANSSKWAKENGLHGFAWQRRYGAFTVSESQVPVVRKYIQNQERHHQKFDFRTEFESLMQANGIPVDGYIWQD
jgi:putative transposase